MGRESKFSPEVRELAVRFVFEHGGRYSSRWEAIRSIGDIPPEEFEAMYCEAHGSSAKETRFN